MNNSITIRYLGAFALLGLASCSTSQTALRGESDDLYFMASDAAVATEFAVANNNPENFRALERIDAEEYQQENFSAKNVNPEYIAKYQSAAAPADEDGTVYFDDSEQRVAQGEEGDINIYNNFRGPGSNFNSGWGMNPWMMSPMMMGGFSPWGMGMGGFYDPFWGPGFGFRPGFNMSLGLGFGMGFNRFGMGFGNRFGMGFGNPFMNPFGMYGMGGFYDPFFPHMGMGMMGMRYGYGMNPFHRPIFVLPGGYENQRQLVRGARPSRGSNLATAGRTRENVATPGSSRSSARREAVNRNSMTSTPSSRANTRSDFSRSQNDYYNANTRRSAASANPVSRSVNSPAMSRTGSTTNRNAYATPANTRTQAPANVNTRSSGTDSRSRYAAPSRSSSPSYNRSTSPRVNNRTTVPSNNRNTYSTPSRSSSPSFSAPSRGSGGGGAVRSSGGGSRRGN